MEKWNCQVSGCKIRAMGVGHPLGLRALGWWIERAAATGPASWIIQCPAHRPDAIPCRETGSPKFRRRERCSQCAGRDQAEKLLPFLSKPTPRISRT